MTFSLRKLETRVNIADFGESGDRFTSQKDGRGRRSLQVGGAGRTTLTTYVRQLLFQKPVELVPLDADTTELLKAFSGRTETPQGPGGHAPSLHNHHTHSPKPGTVVPKGQGWLERVTARPVWLDEVCRERDGFNIDTEAAFAAVKPCL